MNQPLPIIVKVKQLQPGQAVVSLPDNQEISLSLNNLPDNSQEGEELVLIIDKKQNLTARSDEQAKQILNQLLKPDE